MQESVVINWNRIQNTNRVPGINTAVMRSSLARLESECILFPDAGDDTSCFGC